MSWRTRCATPPNDPRSAVLSTLVVVKSPTHIELVETGRYEVTFASGRCIADVRRTRSFDRDLSAAAAPTTQAPPPATAAATHECKNVGAPSRLEVRPSKKLMKPGEAFVFQARVLDDRGCKTDTIPRFSLDQPAMGITVDPSGRVSVDAGAAEGTTPIVVSAAGKDVRVEIEVASKGRYDQLLSQSGLHESGESDEAAFVTWTAESIGGETTRVDDRSKQRRLVFVSVIASLLVLLGVVALVLARRTARARARQAREALDHEAEVSEVLARRRKQEADYEAELEAHRERVAAAKGGTKRRGKICPRCGERFDRSAEFCGKDGTVLVLIN